MNYKYLQHSKTKYSRNKGMTMIVAIIIIAIVMIFTFSLMLVTYTLYASQNKNIASQKNREAANSLSIAIREELTSDTASDDSWLWKYLRCNLYQNDTWPYYEPSVSGHESEYAYRYFNLKKNANYDVDGFPGSIQLCIYWCIPEDPDRAEAIKVSELSTNDKDGSYLYIEIICESGSQKYTVTDKYKIDISGFDLTNPEDLSEQNRLGIMQRSSNYNPMDLDVDNSEKWRFVFDS